jgi:CBS domain-containing protein
LDDRYDEALHGDYFRAFSRFVCDGLDACGYIHCPGEMMAMTDTWRQPRQRWVQYFAQWVNTPEPKALMLTCVFFDQRAIHGKAELLDTLQRTRGNSLFLANRVSNALKRRPPLGLFGNLSLEELSNFERSHLKDAFLVVQTLQGVLGQRYQSGRF